MTSAEHIGAAFVSACRDELEAPKPGNVHVFADGHRMTAADFMRSAEAAAGPLTAPNARVGGRIFRAVEATHVAVGTNTNLGIILLCAPLAAAAETGAGSLREAVAALLAQLDIEDADLAFRAIALASPGGLGRVEHHDVHAPAKVTLAEAMAIASDRDRIAYQFSSNFADIFGLGLPTLAAAASRRRAQEWVTLEVYLAFVAAFPDSHIVRKFGAATAADVRRAANALQRRLQGADDPSGLLGDLLEWDSALKQHAINPGTSADLTVATLFADRLQDILPSAPNNG